jgi:hypothetical protein
MGTQESLPTKQIPSHIIPKELQSLIDNITIEEDTIIFQTIYSIKSHIDFVGLVNELESKLFSLFRKRLRHHEVQVYSDYTSGRIFLKAISKNSFQEEFQNIDRELQQFLNLSARDPKK